MKKSNGRRRGVEAAALGLALTLVAACGSGGGEAEPGASDEPLQFYLSGDANQGGGYAAMAAQYEEETGVEVEIVDIANADLQTRLRNAAQAADLPALARIGAIDPVWKDQLVDLSGVLEGSDIYPDLAAVDSSGKVLSLPSDVTAVGLFINKTLFDEAGVSFPTTEEDIWTWDEFVAAVDQVKAATGTTYGMVMDRSSHRLKSLLFEFGSDFFTADENGEFGTNEKTKEGLEYFYKLNDDSFMPRSVWLSDADGNALFKSGDVVSYYSGSWQIADFAKNIADFEWESVYLPVQPVRATMYGNAASVVVFDDTGQQDAAYDFVEWLYQPENYKKLSETAGFLPVIEGLDVTYASNEDDFQLYNEEIAASDPVVADLKQRDFAYEVAGLATDGDPFRDEVVKYLNDEQDVDTTIENVNKVLTEQLGALPE